MDTTKTKGKTMTKTPEELTEDWKAGKLDWNKFYYIKLTSGEICIDYANGAYFVNGKPQEITMDYSTDEDVKQILAPVLSYDEYKAMQEQLNKEGTWYTEISYKKLKKELESARWYQTVQNEDIAKLRALLKECIYILNEYKHCFDVKHHNMTANIIDKANEVLK